MSMAAVATAYDPSRLPSAETQTVHEGGIKPYYVSKINQLKVRVPFHHNTHTQTLTHTHTVLTFFVAFTSQFLPSPSPLSLPMRPTTAAMPSDTSQHTLQNTVWRTSCPALHAFLRACVGIWPCPNTRQSLMWLNCSFHLPLASSLAHTPATHRHNPSLATVGSPVITTSQPATAVQLVHTL